MKPGIKKLLAMLAVLAVLAGAMQLTLSIKNETTENMYSAMQYTLTAFEASQYVSQIEYGLKYGKELENYLNADELMKKILTSSSYMEGVYIISAGGKVLQAVGDIQGTVPDVSGIDLGEELYSIISTQDYKYVFLDIDNNDGVNVGKLMMKLDSASIGNVISEEQQSQFWQSLIITGEAFLLAAVFIAGYHNRKGRNALLLLSLLMGGVLLLPQGLDCGIEAVKSAQLAERSTAQSAQRIAQVVQQQIDNVVQKGVASEDLTDISSFLRKNAAQSSTVESLAIDSSGRVMAQASTEYSSALVQEFRSKSTGLLGLFLGFSVLLCGGAVLWGRRRRALHKDHRGITAAAPGI